MRLRDLALAVTVVSIWGFNFVVIEVGLGELPPLRLAAARFLLAAIPAVFLLRRPALRWRQLVAFGLVMFALQYALLFSGMRAGVSAGLASLLVQVQVFFTLALAVTRLGERVSLRQFAGALLAFAGIGLIVAQRGGAVSGVGLALVLASALAWSAGNLLTKQLGKVDMLGVIVWSSLFAWPPLLVLSLWLEGPAWTPQAGFGLGWRSLAALAYIVGASTLLGFVIWGRLMSRYPASTVAPFALLVPVTGFVAAALVLGEPLQTWKLQAAALIVGGLGLGLLPRREPAPQVAIALCGEPTASNPTAADGASPANAATVLARCHSEVGNGLASARGCTA